MKSKIPSTLYIGAVLADAMYTTDELCGRLGWDRADIGLALSTGLKRHVFGDNVYIFGADVMEFIRSQPAGGDA